MLFVTVVLVVALFWAIVIVGYSAALGENVLAAEPMEDEKDWERQERRQLEAEALLEGLAEQVSGATADNKKGTLVNLGIAENRRALEFDDHYPLQGDMWLCSGRPLIFALIQLIVAIPLAYALASHGLGWWSAIVALGVVTLPLGLFSFVSVAENTVLGVKRFGEQTLGYLRPGLQFIVPLIEYPEDIPFQALVWGPQAGGEGSTALHLNGVAGGESNPEPGKFVVLLLGRWKVMVSLQITLRFRKARKDAWWNVLNRYESMDEIGEQIAAVTAGVLFTRAREIEKVTEQELEDQGIDSEDQRTVAKKLLASLNSFPEISGEVLKALQRLGHDRLGGILPISVAISSVTPDEELQQWLQVEDEAKIKRRQQELEGEAVQQRSKKLKLFLESFGSEPELMEAFFRLNAQEVQRRFAEAGGETSSLEGLMRAFFAGQVKKVTDDKSPPPSSK